MVVHTSITMHTPRKKNVEWHQRNFIEYRLTVFNGILLPCVCPWKSTESKVETWTSGCINIHFANVLCIWIVCKQVLWGRARVSMEVLELKILIWILSLPLSISANVKALFHSMWNFHFASVLHTFDKESISIDKNCFESKRSGGKIECRILTAFFQLKLAYWFVYWMFFTVARFVCIAHTKKHQLHISKAMNFSNSLYYVLSL